MMLFVIFLAFPLLSLGEETAVCVRPTQLLDYEEACKTDPEVTGNTGSFLEQIQENLANAMEHTKRLINMAKKKLGIKVEEESKTEQGKKCEYYQCIFRKMDSLGSDMYPNMTMMEHWIRENVKDDQLNSTSIKASTCFHAIAMNIAEITTNLLKLGSNLKIAKGGDMPQITDEMLMEPNFNIISACDASTKLMRCLNMDMTCAVFKYP